MSKDMSLAGSEKGKGIFARRSISLTSSLPPHYKTKESEVTKTLQTSPRDRIRRAAPDSASKYEKYDLFSSMATQQINEDSTFPKSDTKLMDSSRSVSETIVS